MIFLCSTSVTCKAQSIYDNNSMQTYLNAYGQMTQRAIQIMHQVQPYREKQYQLYQNGQYEESIRVCQEAIRQYVYYVFDNKGVRDMELLAGDAAKLLNNYSLAISFYTTAYNAGESQAGGHLYSLCVELINISEMSLYNNDLSSANQMLNLVSSTGFTSGKFFYCWGEYFEKQGNYKVAKDYYKKAKKNDYALAGQALDNIKLKIKGAKNQR